MSERRPPRSARYQDRFNEISVPYEHLTSFTNDRSSYTCADEYSEWYHFLNELATRFIVNVLTTDTQFTERQRLVMSRMRDGATQLDIATELGVHQSSIVKTISGNATYEGGAAKKYGGVTRKAPRVFAASKDFQQLIRKIYEELDP